MQLIHKSTLDYLKKLKKNNNKAWFDENRKIYEKERAQFLEFITCLIADLSKINSDLSGIDPKKTLFRINRDIRFSKNKSPYKTNMGSSINKGGKMEGRAGYYFHLEPGSTFIAGGAYSPMPLHLAEIRQEIDYNYVDFKKIIQSTTFKKYFSELVSIDKLKTNPKGYNSDNPAIEFLKHKSLIVSKSFTDKQVLSTDFYKEIISAYKAMHPFIRFLNNALFNVDRK